MRNHGKTKEQLAEELIAWYGTYFEQNGPQAKTVLGVSGGKDSSVVASLGVKSRGADNLVGVTMPNGDQHDIAYSHELCETLGIQNIEVNIKPYADAFEETITKALAEHDIEMSDQAKVNFPARLRMATLYAIAQSLPTGGRVANTCNYSEDYVGYATKYGDAAGDFSPLSELTVSEVRAVGAVLGLPDKFINKVPEDGLSGLTDEENLGFAYDTLEKFFVDGTTGDTKLDAVIIAKQQANQHKLELMPKYTPFTTE